MAVSIVSFSIDEDNSNAVEKFNKLISEYPNVNLNHNTYYVKHDCSSDRLYIKLRLGVKKLKLSESLDLYITPLNYVILGIRCLKVKEWLDKNYPIEKITYATEDN